MNNLFENAFEEGNRQKEKKNRKKVLLFCLIGTAVILGIVVIFAVSFYFVNRSFSGYDVVSEKARKDSNGVTYVPYQGNLLKYSRDGISAIDASGEVLWNGGYEMEHPAVEMRGDYVMVADIGAKKFYVYNGEDQGVCIETMLPIGRAKICEGGKVAVLVQDEDSDVINIYDPYSTVDPLNVEIPTNVADDGYPLDFDLSPDGNSFVISYMLVDNGSMQNKVCFYNFTEVGQDQNMLVGGKAFEKTIPSHIGFLSDDRVAIFCEDRFTLFDNMKKPEQVFEKVFDKDVKSADFDEENILIITGTAGNAEDQTVYLYNFRGKEALAQKIPYSYSNLLMSDGEIIFTDDRSCHILRKNGNEKFSFEFANKCDFFLPASKDNQYYYLDEVSIQLVKLSG